MQDKIEILSADLMKDHPDKLKLVEYWAGVTHYPMGWHYWLDFIWILDHLEKIKLPRGSWIMDAGAGNGVLQFILAARGYNVISLDFAERDLPPAAGMIFNVEQRRHGLDNFEHRYRKFISHKKKKPDWGVKGIIKYLVYEFAPTYINLNMWKEAFKSRFGSNAYGKIVRVLGDFTNLKEFADGELDCIISVSALEHADHADISKAAGEFNRILKKSAYMFLTVSAAKDKDWYFHPARGWCFCEDSIRKIFALDGCPANFVDYDNLFKKLKDSNEIKKRVSRYYLGTADSGLPFGIYEPRYQPVGIAKQKEKCLR
ncbi:MAG: class I SAM-dependent methyltransferase [Candidatus Omnitrophica bacterium]|nr:class I SAM-dependent methyltransferase [Candidatus Omnitrophota bacterium]